MVYYFTSNAVSPSAFIYVGKDKVENEDLIKFGLEEDVWFHADKLSSAHIYLRMNEGSSWESIPEEVLTDLAQLTKANSIEGPGNKKDNVTVIYTPWANLKKDGSMAVGQVSFKDPRKVKRIIVPQRENPIVNRLNKTKVEKFPDLQMEKEEKLKALRKKDQSARLERKKEESRIAQERKDKKWQKEHAYDDLFTGDDDPEEANNQDREDLEDDFM
ncbi:Coiled-coil domain-containing protein [Lachnellula hyalina]|uniref:Coiled-coil domain-containing protein n=1 Tax=Lachnellula hyalina TaxID=1316788 RepID=A0A8H8R8M0_9HELO|nr:Coiled-coil domain-containing protein [Lachnellula hyalina]TVY29706.1 Coiled-coil domain-containing protein [Lachnellula hyalina]